MQRLYVAIAIAAASIQASSAGAEDLMVEKRVFETPSLTLKNGAVLANVKFGYETYGTLNAAGDNAILIPRSYSSDSHVAGKYKPSDAAPGIFDPIIGPGKTIDTNRFFVISSDNLINVATKNPNVTTTGPASTDPKTGKPYGMTFPIVQIRDMVNADKALLDSLGVKRLHAVIGASMGSMQTFEWSVAYPDYVPRAVPILPIAQMDGYTVAQFDNWGAAITLDPNWKGGAYYGGPEPTDGVVKAMDVLHTTQRSFGWGAAFANKPAKPGEDPATSWNAGFAAVASMQAGSVARAKLYDANSILYDDRAMQLFSVGGTEKLEDGFKSAKAKFLIIPAKSDVLFFPAYGQRAAAALTSNGRDVTYMEIEGTGGHFDGVFEIKQAADAIRKVLE